MKVCTVCNEIVSAGQGCDRSGCPFKSSANTVESAPKLDVGFTGRADRAVQAGLDRAGGVARDVTRRAAFIIAVIALVLVGAVVLAFNLWAASSTEPNADAAKVTTSDAWVPTDLLTYGGHYYRIVFYPNVSRLSALSSASNSTFTLNGVTYLGYLATVTSSGEEAFIESAIKSQNGNSYYNSEPASFWLGGKYIGGQWKWTNGPDSGKVVSYSNWGRTEASQGVSEPYLVLNMYSRSDINGAWHSFESTATQYILGYVIEYKSTINNLHSQAPHTNAR